jgi:hypothetical protein
LRLSCTRKVPRRRDELRCSESQRTAR